MKIYLDTVGCRLNQAEIETMANQFRSVGHEIVSLPKGADLAIINTCSVTSEAASDSRQKIRQANRLGAKKVIVTGCWSTLEPGWAEKLPGVDHLVSNKEKDRLVSELLSIPEYEFELEPLNRQVIPGKRMRTRAFIKVQDGCDNRCTFCITTIARGKSSSRSIQSIVNDIQFAQSGGTKEVVLTGVHLGSWGQERNALKNRLGELIESILNETDMTRIRLSSLEPWDIDEHFFELWKNPRLCRHFHFPLQSGSGGVLKRMGRRISPRTYEDLCGAVRRNIPNVSITTDLIVGFPGETDLEFIESLEFVKELEFSGGHVFTYSARPGTVAAQMPNQIPVEIKKERSGEMRDVIQKSSIAHAESFIGSRLQVLWERSNQLRDDHWKLEGFSDNYLKVHALAPNSRWNQVDEVELINIDSHGVQGEIVQ